MKKVQLFTLSCLLSALMLPASAMDSPEACSASTANVRHSSSTFNPQEASVEIQRQWTKLEEKEKESLLPALQRVSGDFNSLNLHDPCILVLLEVYKANKERDTDLQEWAQKIANAPTQTFMGIQSKKEFRSLITTVPLLSDQAINIILDDEFFQMHPTLASQKDDLKGIIKDLGTMDIQHFRHLLTAVTTKESKAGIEAATTVRNILSHHWQNIEKFKTVAAFISFDHKYALPEKFYLNKVFPLLPDLMKKTPNAKQYGNEMIKALAMEPSTKTVDKIAQALTSDNPEEMLCTIKRSGKHYADLKLKKHMLEESKKLKGKMIKIDDKLTGDKSDASSGLGELLNLLRSQSGNGFSHFGMHDFPF